MSTLMVLYAFLTAILVVLLELLLRPLGEAFLPWQLLGILMVALLLLMLLRRGLPNYVRTIVDATGLRTTGNLAANARMGLILFLPSYTVNPSGRDWLKSQAKQDLTPEEIEKALNGLDYNALLLWDNNLTNFGPPTMAIQRHLTKLQYCWIVTSESTVKPDQNSRRYLEVYLKFLHDKVLQGREVEFDTSSSVNTDEDSNVCKMTSQVIQKIYKSASRKPYKLKSSEIIVDVTSGTKSMTIGAVLGSIAGERDIEIVGSEYEPGAGLKKASVPVLIKYKALLIPTE